MKLNLRNKFLLIVLPVLLISMLVAGYFSYNVARSTILEAERQGMQEHITQIKQVTNLWFNQKLKVAKSLSQTPDIIDACKTGNLDRARTTLTHFFDEVGEYENIILTDTQGVIQISAVDEENAAGIDVAAIPVYSENITKAQNGEAHIGEVALSPVTERPVSLITAPVMDQGEIIGIIGTPVEFSVFSESFVAPITIGENGYVYILASDGQTVAHPSEEYILNLDVTQFEFGRSILAEKTGTIYYEWEGDDKIAVFETIDLNNWIIASSATLDDFLRNVNTIRNIVFGVTILSLIVAFVILFYTTRRIVQPLLEGVTFSKRISGGDLTDRVSVNTKDEIGDLAHSLNSMADNLTELVREIQNSVEQVASSSEELSASAQNLANNSTEQASSLEETSASIKTLSQSVDENANNARETRQITTQAATEAEEGGKAVVETVDAMKKIAEQITIVDDIADQTNLLALNAAIEAARAGELGKGFAVVAVEVRKLAERSQVASKQISELAQDSVQRAEAAGQVIQNLVPSIQKASEMVVKIAEACEKQANESEQITNAVEQLDEATQQNSATSEESASASEELSSQAQMLSSLINRFRIRNQSQKQSQNQLQMLPEKDHHFE